MTLTTIKTIIAAIIILLVVIFAGTAIHNMSEDLRGVNGDS